MADYKPAGSPLPIQGALGTHALRTAKAVMVPLRWLTDRFGGSISWNPVTFTATATIDNITVPFTWKSDRAGSYLLRTPALIDLSDSRMYINALDIYDIWRIGSVVQNDSLRVERGLVPAIGGGTSKMGAAIAILAALVGGIWLSGRGRR